MRRIMVIVLAVVLAASMALTGCEGDNQNTDRKISEGIEQYFLRNQPLDRGSFSQYRETLLEIERVQKRNVATTSFFFNVGTTHPLMTCPSVGLPIPSTAQLSNPFKVTNEGDGSSVIGNMEPNGVYTGDSSGTNVMCVDAEGRTYLQYWEGPVSAVTGIAKWDPKSETIVLVGAPSFEFSAKVKKGK